MPHATITIMNSRFIKNNATNDNCGAISGDSSTSLSVYSCNFTDNYGLKLNDIYMPGSLSMYNNISTGDYSS